jgi:hypothetical protein
LTEKIKNNCEITPTKEVSSPNNKALNPKEVGGIFKKDNVFGKNNNIKNIKTNTAHKILIVSPNSNEGPLV